MSYFPPSFAEYLGLMMLEYKDERGMALSVTWRFGVFCKWTGAFR
jgi:hypothetical protein